MTRSERFTRLRMFTAAVVLPLFSACPDCPGQGDPEPLDLDSGPEPELWTCPIDAVPEFITADCLKDILSLTAGLAPDGQEEAALEEMCTSIRMTFIDPIKHSTGEDYPPDVTKKWAELKAFVIKARMMTVEELAAEFPCGEGGHGQTVCGDAADQAEGPFIQLTQVLAAAAEEGNDHHHQVSYVFDRDGDESNNYFGGAAYPYDFWNNTDYQIATYYDPTNGWSLTATDAAGGMFTQVSSGARINVYGNTITAFVPMSEMLTDCPKFRLTNFTHLGDWGLEAPNVWNGDAEPPVEEEFLYNLCDFTSF